MSSTQLRIFFLSILMAPIQSANILGVFMYPSIGHQVVFQQIYRELSLRGHHLTVLTPDPLNDPSLKNLTEISLSFAYDLLKESSLQDLSSKDFSLYEITEKHHQLLDAIAEKELSSPQFQELISDRSKHFDLVMLEFIHPVMYALADRFKAPSIALSSMTISSGVYDAVGNPNHPVVYPEPVLNFRPGKLTMWQKIRSILYFLWGKYHHHMVFVPRADKMARKYFGNEIPYVGDLERNVSMMFLNTNPILHVPRPNVPAIVEIGPMDIQEPQTLPQDLKTILDEAKNGFVYFSLGSSIQTSRLSKKIRNAVLDALSELPFKVLLKWDQDLPHTSDIVVRKWFPQRDLLAHPNLRVFVTQGSQQSIEEAVFREVPMIGIPFMDDQPNNVRRMVELGIAEQIHPRRVTKTRLKNVINKVANTPRYKTRVQEIQYILFDKPMSSLESAVWWTEYVIRYEGARHLRSPAVDMPWYQYLLIDVIFVLMTISVLIMYAIYKIFALIAKLFKWKSSRTVKKLKVG